MKTSKASAGHDLEPQFAACLRGLVARVPFLKLVSLRKNAPVAAGIPDRTDIGHGPRRARPL